jgi:hypothetical protein
MVGIMIILSHSSSLSSHLFFSAVSFLCLASLYNHYVYKENTRENILKLIDNLVENNHPV